MSSKNELTTIVNPGEFVIADGYTLQTIKEVWTDGSLKEKLRREAKGDKKKEEAFAIRRSKHKFTVKFIFKGVNLGDFLKAMADSTSSMTVKVQQKVRSKYGEQGDDFIEKLSDSEKVVEIQVSELLAGRSTATTVDRAKKEVNKTSSLSELEELEQYIQKKKAALLGDAAK